MRDESLNSRKNRHLSYFRREGTDRGDPGLCGVGLHQSALSCVFPDEVALGTNFLGTGLGAPLWLAPVTGGTSEGESFNRAAARCALNLRLPMATGSLRIAFEQPETVRTFDVNSHGELPLFFGNLGVAAALRLGPERVGELCDLLRMHGLFLYFNHAQELAQPSMEHERFDPARIPEFIKALGKPVIVKETGMGFSSYDLSKISEWPIAGLDTGGAGGSCFFHVEHQESVDSNAEISEMALQMGIPTALVVYFANRYHFPIIAGGGIRTGLDMARALTLGARLVSCAAPLVRAWSRDSADGLNDWVTSRMQQLRMIMSLCGARNLDELRKHPVTLDARFTETI